MTRHNRRARRLDERAAEAMLAGRAVEDEPALSAFVREALDSIPDSAPAPSSALAAMLEQGVPAQAELSGVPGVPARRRPGWARAGVAAGAALGLVVSAGAANALPTRAQDAVADVVGWVTPIEFPRPAVLPVPTSTPTPTPTPSTDDHGGLAGTDGPGSSGSGTGGTDDSTSSGSGGADDTTRTSSGSGGSDSGSGSSGSDDGVKAPAPGPTSGSGSELDSGSGSSTSSPKPSPTPSESPDDHSGGTDH